jgi:hypothetical protein
MNRSRRQDRRRESMRPLGLYGYGENRYATPFSLFAIIVVGVVFCIGGVLSLLGTLSARGKEVQRLGSAQSHWSGFVLSGLMVITGAFIAHPGIIYCARRFSTFLARRHARIQPGSK